MERLKTRYTMAIPLLLCLLVLGAFMARAEGRGESAKPTLFINLTSGKEDLHAVTMAYQLAGHGLDAGREVVLFFNVRAPELVEFSLSEEFRLRDNLPLRDMLANLMKRGARVMVCPHCMGEMGVLESELVQGAEVAMRETLFAQLGPDAVVFTY